MGQCFECAARTLPTPQGGYREKRKRPCGEEELRFTRPGRHRQPITSRSVRVTSVGDHGIESSPPLQRTRVAAVSAPAVRPLASACVSDAVACATRVSTCSGVGGALEHVHRLVHSVCRGATPGAGGRPDEEILDIPGCWAWARPRCLAMTHGGWRRRERHHE